MLLRRFAVVAVFALVFGLTTSVGNGTSARGPADAAVTGDYLITVRSVGEVDAGVAAARAAGGAVRHVYRHAVSGFAASLTPGALNALSKNPRIAHIESDGVVTTTSDTSAGTTQNNATWGLDRIDQRDLPLSTTYTYTSNGSGVRAYIVDTGVHQSHVDFGGRFTPGYTSINDGLGTGDCNGHGTHVAGTVAGNNWGVAKAATIVPVRVLDCNGSGSWSGVIAGLDWIAANHPANTPGVANLSLGGGASSTVDSAVQKVIDKGVSVVVAAGNSQADACNYSPARAKNAITVGATTSTDARASYSNFGTCLDLFAPGSAITSAWHTSNTATNRISGTSMAAPHVAGVVALVLQNSTTATPLQIAQSITSQATTGKVTSAGSGSPNLLLYSLNGETIEAIELVTPEVSSITVTPGGGRWVNATAVVQAVIAGEDTPATSLGITGIWYHDGSSVATQNGVTDSNGRVSFNVQVRTRSGELDFCVTGLEGTGYVTVNHQTTPICPQGLSPLPEEPPVEEEPVKDPVEEPADEPVEDEPAKDPVEEPADTWELQITLRKDKGWQFADLRWSAQSEQVSIYRDGNLIGSSNPGSTSFTDDIKAKGGGTYTYKLCTSGGCSNEITVSF
jgi:subtilisin family serine protease